MLGPVAAPGEGELVTAAGARVRARHVIVAADGALPALVPDYEGRVQARRLHMVASAPIAERIVDQLVYPRWGYEYFQQRPDGRILLGGYSDLDGPDSYTDREEGSTEIWARLEAYLREELGLRHHGHPPLGRRGGLHRGPAAVRGRGPRPARAYGCRAATRATATCPATRRDRRSRTRSRAGPARSRVSRGR